MEYEIASLAVSLAQALTKDTVNWVRTEIEVAKKKKDLIQAQNEYEAIIQTLVNEKLEIQRIAQQYQQLYSGITISDEDFEHLHKTLSEMLPVAIGLNPESRSGIEAFQTILDLINVNLLKSMQLIGFDYKEAIGRPLTQVCAKSIENLGKPKNPPKQVPKK